MLLLTFFYLNTLFASLKKDFPCAFDLCHCDHFCHSHTIVFPNPLLFLFFKLEYNCLTLFYSFLMFTRIPSLLSLPFPTTSHPSRSPQSNRLNSGCYKAASISYLFYTWECIYVNVTFSTRLTLSFPCVHKSTSLFSKSVFLFLPCK